MSKVKKGDVVFNINTGRYGIFQSLGVAKTITNVPYDVCLVKVKDSNMKRDEVWKISDTCFEQAPRFKV